MSQDKVVSSVGIGLPHLELLHGRKDLGLDFGHGSSHHKKLEVLEKLLTASVRFPVSIGQFRDLCTPCVLAHFITKERIGLSVNTIYSLFPCVAEVIFMGKKDL